MAIKPTLLAFRSTSDCFGVAEITTIFMFREGAGYYFHTQWPLVFSDDERHGSQWRISLDWWLFVLWFLPARLYDSGALIARLGKLDVPVPFPQ